MERETQCSLACPPMMMLLLDNDVETSSNVDKNFIVVVSPTEGMMMKIVQKNVVNVALQSTGFVS